VFLLGDAAHLTPPFIGQGIGAGLRDATNLVWKLAAVLDGSRPDTILATYESERSPHVRHLIRLAIGLGRAMTGGGRVAALARQVVAPRLHLVPGLRARVLDSASPALRRSPLNRRTGPWSLAGRLCPNAPLGGGGRFDDEVAARYSVVCVGPVRPDLRVRAERASVVVLEVTPGEELFEWLRRGRVTAALVRPDRTVQRAGRDLGKLLADVDPA
jgi:3-(3-hydroxy-phenyl)propionate hydroxylase